MRWRTNKEKPELNQTIYAQWDGDHIYKCVYMPFKYHYNSKDLAESVLISYNPAHYAFDDEGMIKRKFIQFCAINAWIPSEELDNIIKGK